MRITVSLVLTAATLTSASAFGASSIEVRGSGVYYAPQGAAATGSEQSFLESVDWDSGSGFEAQAVYWRDYSPWGFAASIGAASWEIKDYSDIAAGQLNKLKGDADLTLVGLSAIRKLTTDSSGGSKLKAEIEAGAKHISTDASIEGVWAVGLSDGRILALRQRIKTDDVVVGQIALNGKYELDPKWNLFATAGFQFDLSAGDSINQVPGFNDYPAGDTEMQAAFGKIGISYLFE